MHAKEQTYFLNVKINNEQDKNCDEQSNQVGSRSPAPEDNGNRNSYIRFMNKFYYFQ